MTPVIASWLPFLKRWVITTLGVLVAANVVSGINYDTVAALLVASLLLGILNAFLKPVMLLLSLPLLVATLGLFVLFINASLLYLVGQIVEGFRVETFGAAFWGGLVVSLVSLATNALVGAPPNGTHVRRARRRPGPSRPSSGGDGPVIDV